MGKNTSVTATKDFKYNRSTGFSFGICKGDTGTIFTKGKTVHVDIVKSKDSQAEGHRLILTPEEFKDRFEG